MMRDELTDRELTMPWSSDELMWVKATGGQLIPLCYTAHTDELNTIVVHMPGGRAVGITWLLARMERGGIELPERWRYV